MYKMEGFVLGNLAFLFVLPVALFECGYPAVSSKTGPVRETKRWENEIAVDDFLGIPSAKPPVGDLRFKDDQPPEDCSRKGKDLDNYPTVEDFECCAPYMLPNRTRLYYQSGSGRQITLELNKCAYKRYHILPRALVDVRKIDMSVKILNNRISMPIAAAPSAYHRLASDRGEIDTVRAVSKAGTLMVLSSFSTTRIEDVAAAAEPGTILWMQLYIYRDRRVSSRIIKRAENSGFKAFALTVDTPMFGDLPVNALQVLEGNTRNISAVNVAPASSEVDPSLTLDDIAWVKRQTKLPIVAKGIMTAEDALRAAKAGVAAVWVSNHGGRQLDSAPATIDVLEDIVKALKYHYPHVEVYLDGGIRNGYDCFKALGRGAKVVFVGRPILWGLTVAGERGVSKVLNILRTELNQTMILAGTPMVSAISTNMVKPGRTCGCHDDEMR